MLPEEYRTILIGNGAPRRKYTAVVRLEIAGGRVIEDAIIEQGWIIALSRNGMSGVFEERIDFDPRQILSMDVKQII